MDEIKTVATVVGVLVSGLALILGVVNFINGKFGDKARAVAQITDIQSRLLAQENDYKLFIEETVPDSRRERDRQIDRLEMEIIRRLTSVEGYCNQIPEIATKVDLFWGFVRENFPKMLLHHGEPGRDALLMKLSNNTISHSEGIDLKALLESEFEHMADKKSTEALINRFTLIALEAVLQEQRV